MPIHKLLVVCIKWQTPKNYQGSRPGTNHSTPSLKIVWGQNSYRGFYYLYLGNRLDMLCPSVPLPVSVSQSLSRAVYHTHTHTHTHTASNLHMMCDLPISEKVGGQPLLWVATVQCHWCHVNCNSLLYPPVSRQWLPLFDFGSWCCTCHSGLNYMGQFQRTLHGWGHGYFSLWISSGGPS